VLTGHWRPPPHNPTTPRRVQEMFYAATHKHDAAKAQVTECMDLLVQETRAGTFDRSKGRTPVFALEGMGAIYMDEVETILRNNVRGVVSVPRQLAVPGWSDDGGDHTSICFGWLVS
jgi:ATP-dependent protease HslVU (ClpYQ) ATPase subunit